MKWLLDHEDEGNDDTIVINSDTLQQILAGRKISITYRANRLLRHFADCSSRLGSGIDLGKMEQIKTSLSFGTSELRQLCEFLKELGSLKEPVVNQVMVTPQGYISLEEAPGTAFDTNQAFVAMWFDERTDEAWTNGFEPAIYNTWHTPFRIDKKEHNKKIDDEIISEIRRSKFLVADFTGHRGGVYFEAGLAMGLGLPIFWTCHSEDIKALHFDIRQYNCIAWKNPAELADRLKRRIIALVGMGTINPDRPT